MWSTWRFHLLFSKNQSSYYIHKSIKRDKKQHITIHYVLSSPFPVLPISSSPVLPISSSSPPFPISTLTWILGLNLYGFPSREFSRKTHIHLIFELQPQVAYEFAVLDQISPYAQRWFQHHHWNKAKPWLNNSELEILKIKHSLDKTIWVICLT